MADTSEPDGVENRGKLFNTVHVFIYFSNIGSFNTNEHLKVHGHQHL